MPIRSDRLRLDGARDRNRTGTPLDAKQQILSLRCLPISPPGRARKKTSSQTRLAEYWRRGPESNWADRICNPVHNRFATAPCGSPTRGRKREASASLFLFIGAGDEARTRDLNLGKVALYQLSYSRIRDTTHIASRSIHRNHRTLDTQMLNASSDQVLPRVAPPPPRSPPPSPRRPSLAPRRATVEAGSARPLQAPDRST